MSMEYVQVKEEADWVCGESEECVRVKEEYDVREYMSVTEEEYCESTAACVGLYAEHEVKHELVLGPEQLQPQDIAFTLQTARTRCDPLEFLNMEENKSTSNTRADKAVCTNSVPEDPVRPCFVRLERIIRQPRTSKTRRDISKQKSNQRNNKKEANTAIELEVERNKFICDNCGRQFACKNTLTRHIRIHSNCVVKDVVTTHKTNTDEKPFSCDICSKRFLCKKYLKVHLEIHVERSTCEICNKRYTETYLKQHKLIHSREKKTPQKRRSNKATCEICKKKYSSLCTVKQHMRIHTGEKPYKCDICQKEFVDLSSFKRHKRIHTGEKPYTCEMCKRLFSDLSHLIRHKRRIHSREKPYTCTICNKQYSDSYFEHHKLIHSDAIASFTCETCKKKYRSLYYLNMHKRSHINRKAYTCEICKKQYSCNYYFKQHKLIHRDEKP